MERYYDTMRNMIELTDTGIEALEYLAGKLLNGENDTPLYLYADFSNAFFMLCNNFKIFEKKFKNSNKIKELEVVITRELLAFLSASQAEDRVSMKEILLLRLIPAVKSYRAELAVCFNPFILC